MTGLNYILLFLTWGTYWLVTKPRHFVQVLKKNWRVYAAMSLFDFEANYFVNRAYGLTSTLSVTLLNSSSTVWVVVFSLILLKARYKLIDYLSILLCIGGLVMIVLEDLNISRLSTEAPTDQYILGNVFALIAGLLFSLANITQEYAVKSYGGPVEYCVFIGFFGSIVALIQIAIVERVEFSNWALLDDGTVGPVIGCIVGWAILMWILYSTVGWYFQYGGRATVFNLSLLTVNIYTLILSLIAFKDVQFTARTTLYFVAFALIVGSLAVFNWNPREIRDMFNINYEKDIESPEPEESEKMNTEEQRTVVEESDDLNDAQFKHL